MMCMHGELMARQLNGGGCWCRVLVSGGYDASISVFELETLTCLRSITELDYPAKVLSLSADASHVAYVTEAVHGVCIDNVITGESSVHCSPTHDMNLHVKEAMFTQHVKGIIQICIIVAIHLLQQRSEATSMHDIYVCISFTDWIMNVAGERSAHLPTQHTVPDLCWNPKRMVLAFTGSSYSDYSRGHASRYGNFCIYAPKKE